MGKYFGTDGIRGQANKTLTIETVYKVGRFLGDYFDKDSVARIVIGKDTRLSSSMFESALIAGLSASGADVYLLGYCSTPCLAYTAIQGKYSCGVMISASHNPFYDNGIKVFGNDGLKIQDEVEKLIEDYIDDPTGIPYQTDGKIGHIVDAKAAITHYQNWLLSLYPKKHEGMKLLVDLANGSNCYTAKEVLKKIGADVTYINDDPDGTNINDGCGSTHLEMLSSKITEGQYDLGFAFDGDADRVLFVDRFGKTIDGDQIMYLISRYLKEKGRLTNNKMVTTVMSNIGLFKALDAIGIGYEVTAVGDKNVVDCLIRNSYVVGGEQSGHIICTHDSNFGDGLKTALLVLEALEYYQLPLEKAVEDLKIYPQLLVNIRVKEKKTVLEDEEIGELIGSIQKKLSDNGRILVRPSGTEPLIRVMVEAESPAVCKDYVYQVIDKIKEKSFGELVR